jgi:hypothetical protein
LEFFIAARFANLAVPASVSIRQPQRHLNHTIAGGVWNLSVTGYFKNVIAMTTTTCCDPQSDRAYS